MGELVDFGKKFKLLVKRARELIYINAAIADEVSKIQEKISKISEERNFLIQRLMQKKSQCGKKAGEGSGHAQVIKTGGKGGSQTKKKRHNPKKSTNDDKDDEEEDDDDNHPKKKPKYSSTAVLPRKASLVPLDSSGRPIFPMELGPLTVYSIGEIVTAPNYHSYECIYPIGYCSTRVFTSIDPSASTCLYTCKVTDLGDRPKFEILSEDLPGCSFVGLSPNQSHLKLLNCINSNRGAGSVPLVPNGAAFFGLTHPTLQNLVQCFPGARKCADYKWVKFEVTKDPLQMDQDGLQGY